MVAVEGLAAARAGLAERWSRLSLEGADNSAVRTEIIDVDLEH
jgi:hypothetical protein